MKPILLLLGSLVLLVLVFLSGVIITANVIAEPEPHKFANIDTPDLWTSKPKEVDPTRQSYERLPTAPQLPPQTAVNEQLKSATPASQSMSQTAAVAPENPPVNSAVDHTMTASVQPQPVDIAQPTSALNNAVQPEKPQNSSVDAFQAQFCYARYRSYRVEDNSYQPFEGGPRRQCQAPGARPVVAATPGAGFQTTRDVASANTGAASRMRVQGVQGKLPALPPEAIPTDDEWRAVETGNDIPRVVETAGSAGSANSHDAGSHQEWCANRYQSYRADDNSYQPFDGSPRRSCQSPFG